MPFCRPWQWVRRDRSMKCSPRGNPQGFALRHHMNRAPLERACVPEEFEPAPGKKSGGLCAACPPAPHFRCIFGSRMQR